MDAVKLSSEEGIELNSTTDDACEDIEIEPPVTEPIESPEERRKKELENQIPTILEKLRNLPSSASELKTVPISLDFEKVYFKLCRTLNVPINYTLLFSAERESVDLGYQGLGDIGIIPAAKALALCKGVSILDLKHNKLGPKALAAIASLLDQNESISRLDLSGNAIGKGSARFLSRMLQNCFSVEFLDLSGNSLGDDELADIGLALMKVDSVRELVLASNDFGGSRAAQFGACLAKCGSMARLDLSRCHLQEGAGGIFAALKTSNLTELDVSRNGVPDEAMPALAIGLRGCKSLKVLDISRNAISKKGAAALAPGLKGASTLEVLNMAHNPIQGSGAFALLSSVGGGLKVLDLTGIKVNIAFLKMHSGFVKAGKGIKVLFGSVIRSDCGTRDIVAPAEDDLDKTNVVTFLGKLANDKGLVLRKVLMDLHANFITEQHAALAEEGAKATEPEERPAMTAEDLAKGLVASPLAVQRALALKIAELLSSEGSVDMWGLIARVRWRPDDLCVNVKAPPRPPPSKKDKKKK